MIGGERLGVDLDLDLGLDTGAEIVNSNLNKQNNVLALLRWHQCLLGIVFY